MTNRSRPIRMLAWLGAFMVLTGSVGAGEIAHKGRELKVPDGFTIELIAGHPQVDRPITAAMDEQGRLYVADSSGSNEKVQIQLEERTHRIVRLEDQDGDGKYESQTVFADRMMFPEGTMWLDGSLYVAAPPSIWKLTDTDGDGVADDRVEWFQGKTLTGCANDLHGPYAGPDGWIYWTKGAFAEQTYERPGKSPFVTSAAHIFRARPDGSGLEPVMTGGMDNPVDVTFTPGGERIFSTTFFHQPGGGMRDGLAHAVYGGVYGKVNRVLDAPVHQRTSPELMPVLLHMGPAAPSGLHRLESNALGDEYQDDLFACYFNLHKVGRHKLAPAGATFATQDEDFVTSSDLDFHPTDVIEDADGSLLVIDTGGWYKLCCPSSQLSKPDELGGIYRVRRADAKPIDDPRGLKLDWENPEPAELAKRLADPRPAVRRRAVAALAKAGESAQSVLSEAVKPSRPVESRRNAVWTAVRIGSPEALAVVRAGLADPDQSIRQAAANAVSLVRDAEAAGALTKMIAAGPLANRRAAAEALGRIGDAAAVPHLLKALGDKAADDRMLNHSLTYALIQIDDPKATAAGLASNEPRVLRSTLMAIDQMEGGKLEPRKVADLLASADAQVKETASWIIGRHPDWAEALTDFFRDRLKRDDLAADDRADLERQLAGNAASPGVQELLGSRLVDAKAAKPAKLSALKAMAQAQVKDLPAGWRSGLAAILSGADDELARQAVATIRARAPQGDPDGALAGPLLAIAGREDLADDARLEAFSAVPGGLAKVQPDAFAFLVSKLGEDESAAVRGLASDILSRAKLSREQLDALADALGEAGPLEVNRLLAAFDASTDDALGVKLVKVLGESSALSSLRIDALKEHFAKFGPKTHEAAEGLYSKINADAAKQQARIAELLTQISGGDIRRGQLVFHSEKAACHTCHAIGYRGGDVGPDLTRVGGVRSERDLLEAIIYPSASFIRSYEPVLVATADGRVVNGLLKNETADELTLVTGADQQVRVAKSDIDEIRPGTVSVMPAGLDQQLTTQELLDLVAFLKACQ